MICMLLQKHSFKWTQSLGSQRIRLDMDGTPLGSFQLNTPYMEQCFHLENVHAIAMHASSDRVLFCIDPGVLL